MAKTYSLEDFASGSPQTYSLADFGGVPAAETYSLKDFELPSQTTAQPEPAAPVVAREEPATPPVQEEPVVQAQAPVAAEQAPPALEEPTQEELAAASKPAFIYRKPGSRTAPVTDPNAINMPGSVMDKQVVPDSEFERTSKAPIRPEVRAAFNSQWDAATPKQRDFLALQSGLTGQLAREREELFTKQAEALGEVPTDNTLRKVDPRVEERRARLIAEGEAPEFADTVARLGAERGVLPGREIAAVGTIQPSEFDFETNRFFREQVGANNPLVRGTAKAVLGLGKSVVGINEFLADSIGADKYAKFLKEGNKWVREKEGAVGEKGDFLERNLEGAISSIGQQLPWMIGVAATGGGKAIPLVAMGLQTFGQMYSDGRSQKQNVQQAATRASIFAAFEVIGERFGLTDQLKALRGAVKGMDNSQIIGLLANALKKEVPGELFTTTGQFAADKWMPQGYALNPNATVEDFVKQVADTIAQTVLQAGVMGAGTTGVSTARRFMGERGYGEGIAAADAETARTAALQKAANMFKPATPRAKTADQPTTETVPAAEETSEFDEYGYLGLPQYQELQEKISAAGEQFSALSVKADSLPEGSDERVKATRAANKFFADFYEPLSAQLDAIEQAYASQAPTPVAETVPTTQTARVEPTFTVDPETGEVITAPAAPVEAEALIEREAARFAKTYNLPLDLATEAVRGQVARGELDVDRTRTRDDTGRVEPSVSVSLEGTAAAQGVTPSDTSGLADTVGDTRGADVGEGAERAALGEIPTLTERAPAPTYAKLLPDDKAGVLQEAQNLWRSGEANLPMAKAWNSLPSWKRDMFAEEVYANYDEITTNGEALRAAVDKVVGATKPSETKVEIPTLTERAPAAEIKTEDVELATKQQTVIDRVVKDLEKFDNLTGESTPNRPYPDSKSAAAEIKAVMDQYGFDAPVSNGARYPVSTLFAAWSQAVIREKAGSNRSFPNFSTWIKGRDERIVDQLLDERKERLIKEKQTTPAAPIEQAQTKLAEAETAVAEATTPDEKKEATQQRNVARQEVKQAQAATETPATIETPVASETPAAVEVAKPKRGRRKIERTVEAQAIYDAGRAAQQKQANKAADKVTSLINLLSKNVDATTPAKRKDAIDQLNKFATGPETRTKNRSGKRAKAFLAQSDKITATERTALADKLAFEKSQIPKPLAAYAQTASKPVKAFYKFTKATQALNHIMRNGTPFERALAVRLKPFLNDVRLVIVDDNSHPDIVKMLTGTDKGISASGAYNSGVFGADVRSMIVLRGENLGNDPSRQGVNNVIFLHEALHAATAAKIAEYRKLIDEGKPVPLKLEEMILELQRTMNVAKAHYEKLKASGAPISPSVRHAFKTVGIATFPEEFVAYGLTNPDIQEFLFKAPGELRQDRAIGFWKNLFSRFVNIIREEFGMDSKHQSALQDLMLVTEGIMQLQETSPAAPTVNDIIKLNAKVDKADEAVEKVALSIQSSEAPNSLQEAAKQRSFAPYRETINARWGGMSVTAKKGVLFVIPTPEILAWKGKDVPAFKDIDDAVQRLSGMRQMLLSAYTKNAETLGKFARKQGKKGMDAMATAMHTARLTAVSPSTFTDRADALKNDPKIVQLTKEKTGGGVNQNQLFAIDKLIQERRDSINVVFDAWEKLGQFPDGHKNYKMVRQFYKDAAALTRALLDRNINRLGLKGDVNDPSTPKGRLMLSVRRMYEDSDFKGIDEYFPFMRHGTFVLTVNRGERREVYHYDSQDERQDAINRRARQLKVDPENGDIFKVRRELDDKGDRDRAVSESKMLTEMFNAIETATETPLVNKENLKDELYQVYLATLPEQSFRKNYIHADNVTGFSADIFRNFKTSATRIASQVAKLRYAPDILEGIQRAKDSLDRMSPAKKAELDEFVNEMERRALGEINPKPENAAINFATQLSFYLLLTGVGSAIIQTSAIPLFIMPDLNTNFGYANSAKALAKWMSVYKSLGFKEEDADGVRRMIPPTVKESSLVRSNPIYQRAFNEALALGILAQGITSNTFDLSRTPNSAVDKIYKKSGRLALQITSGLFSSAERLTREISYMLAFDLAYKKSGDFDKSVEKAVNVVQTYIGRYDRFSRPPVMRGPGKMLLQFKMYPAVVTAILVKNTLRVAGTQGKEEAIKAVHLLSGILLMGTLFYGATGLPLYNVICSVIDALLDSLEDEEGYLNRAAKKIGAEEFAKRQTENKRVRISKDAFTAMNSDMRFRYEFLPRWFGGMTFGGENENRFSVATMIERGPISVLSDVNVGPRMSLNGIWLKPVRESENIKEYVLNHAEAMMPPAAGASKKVIEGTDDLLEGDILKGIAKLVGPFYGNPLKGEELRQEGVKNRKGDTILSADELSTTNIIAQATGINSTRAAAIQDRNFQYKNQEIIAKKKRAALLGDYGKLVVSPKKDPEDRAKVLADWKKKLVAHNKRYPVDGIYIDEDTTIESGESALERAGKSVRGYRLDDTLAEYFRAKTNKYNRQIMGK